MTNEERIINRLQNLAIEKSLNMENCQDIADVYEKHFNKYTKNTLDSQLSIHSVSGGSSDEPENCPKEYNKDVCDGCEFREYETVSHPGGCSYASAEKAKCGWGHWEDDF
jgi:hypothetical protein